MALNQVNMNAPQQVQKQQTPQKDWKDYLLEGLQIANGITGVYSNVTTAKRNNAELEAQNDARNGISSAKEYNAMVMSGMQPTAEGGDDTIPVNVRQGDDVRTQFLKKSIAPKQTAQELIYGTGPKGEKVAVAWDKTGPLPKDFKPWVEPKAPELTTVETVDENGKPVTKIVPKVAGGTFIRPAKEDDGKIMPSQAAQQIGVYDSASDQLTKLADEWKSKVGTFSGAAQFFPGTDASKYNDARDVAAQNIGLILEGGKLTESDLDRYKAMLPSSGDGPERAQQKIDRLQWLIANKKENSIAGAKNAGFNTQGFESNQKPTVSVDLGSRASGQATAAPAQPKMPSQIMQNGHIYKLNVKTGKYE
jgi:hypothetical protein